VTTFWQEHQVGGPYSSLEESEQALEDRLTLYPTLLDLMPVHFPGQTVLDYGCGPGHDTLLFLRSGARKLYFADVSWQALQTTSDRLQMHGLRSRAFPILLPDELPTVEHIHCAGVLHHIEAPIQALFDLREALGEEGEARVMVYDGDTSTHSQSEVPITEWWTRKEFLALAAEAGFKGKYVGSYECSSEWRPDCQAACYSLT